MTVHMQTADEQAEWQQVITKPVMDAFLELTPDSAHLIELLDEI